MPPKRHAYFFAVLESLYPFSPAAGVGLTAPSPGYIFLLSLALDLAPAHSKNALGNIFRVFSAPAPALNKFNSSGYLYLFLLAPAPAPFLF